MPDTEADDRTQAPSKQRRLLAREQGQAAHSRELTAALGLLGAAIVLRFWGQDLAEALLSAVREPFASAAIETASPSEVATKLRLLATTIARPLLMIVSGYAAAAFVAHQAQVQGLWAPSLLAPDPARLWKPGRGPGLSSDVAKGLWGLVKTVLVAILAAWAIRSEWASLVMLADLEIVAIARASGGAICRILLILSVSLVLLGLPDYMIVWLRFEAGLRMTPGQHREELRSMDGDPSLRARRRQIAKAWRLDSGEVLQGASVMLLGPGGLTVVLAGGPPPTRVEVRSILSGASGERLRKAAERQMFRSIDAPELARRIAHRKPPTLPLTPDLLTQLASAWEEIRRDPPPSRDRSFSLPR